MNIYVGNIDYRIQENQLKELFEQFGEVKSVSLITDKFTGKNKGFAFVDMPEDNQGTDAIERLNGYKLSTREITVSQARPQGEPRENNFRRSNNNGNGNRNRY